MASKNTAPGKRSKPGSSILRLREEDADDIVLHNYALKGNLKFFQFLAAGWTYQLPFEVCSIRLSAEDAAGGVLP